MKENQNQGGNEMINMHKGRQNYCHSGFWYKTQGGFYRAYSFHTFLGYGPFFTVHEAFQFIIDNTREM